jgi:hypothetical protein
MTKIDKVDAALDAGQLWRAKEILAGRIGSAEFSPELCERFGQLLLRMGDDLQAGKYLFLSGVRRPEYESAIRLFLRRYSRAGWQSLLGSFPAAARCAVWADMPQTVRNELRDAGVPILNQSDAVWGTARRAPTAARGWRGCLMVIAVVLFVGLLLSYLIVLVTESRTAGAR